MELEPVLLLRVRRPTGRRSGGRRDYKEQAYTSGMTTPLMMGTSITHNYLYLKRL